MNYDNPAARLLAILDAGRMEPPTSSCRAVWKKLLAVSDDQALLMSRLGKVMELPLLTVQAIKERYPDQGNSWTHWEGQVNVALTTQNLNGEWKTFIGHIDDHTLNYLRITSDLLQAKSNTKLIVDNDLSSIRERLDAILGEVLNSDASDEIKKYLVRNLRKIITAIDEYRLTGAIELLDVVETTLGHAFVDKSYKSFLTDTELGRRIIETLGATADVITVAVGLPQLSAAIAMIAG